MARNRLYNEHH